MQLQPIIHSVQSALAGQGQLAGGDVAVQRSWVTLAMYISLFPQPGKLADFGRDGRVLAVPGDITDAVFQDDHRVIVQALAPDGEKAGAESANGGGLLLPRSGWLD